MSRRCLIFNVAVPCCILLLCQVATGRRGYVFSTSLLEKRLKSGFPDGVELAQVSDTPIIYVVWGIRTFPYPAQAVAAVATDFQQYPKIFRHVYRCDRITDPSRRLSSLGTWYVEGRVGRARVWAIGDIDTMHWVDSTHFRFFARQNESPSLEARWRYVLDGWINLRTRGVKFAAFIVAVGPDSCRLGVIAQGIMIKPMPQWLINLSIRIVLPQLLNDLEQEVQRRQRLRNLPSEPTEPSSPWWKRFLRFFLGSG